MPEMDISKTEFPQKAELSENDFVMDYSAEASRFKTAEPTKPQQNEYGYFDEIKEKTEAKTKDAVADIILTKVGQYGFVKEDVVRFLSDTDPRDIVDANYRVVYNFDETYAKDVLQEKLREASDIAVEIAEKSAEYIARQAIDDLEKFDDTSITAAYYLNDFNGASLMGHAGVLLVDSDGEGILFSFYPQDQNVLKDSASEMRISVFSKGETKTFLENKKSYGISTTGKYRSEQYENVLPYFIGPAQGKAMFEQAVAITAMNDFKYNLLEQNCDHVALSILRQGGINAEKKYIPNLTYAAELI
ncbi:MAG: hypothetical protein IJD97_01315 [Clostridia bacterium]|nr:hypothetical protein [Clostridia bacterium]